MECKGCVGFDWFKYWDNGPTHEGADPSNRDSNKGMYSNKIKEPSSYELGSIIVSECLIIDYLAIGT